MKEKIFELKMLLFPAFVLKSDTMYSEESAET
jgi:hypothetical protein